MCLYVLGQTICKINKYPSVKLKLKTQFVSVVCTEGQQCSRYYILHYYVAVGKMYYIQCSRYYRRTATKEKLTALVNKIVQSYTSKCIE